jgi:hypothetical protein
MNRLDVLIDGVNMIEDGEYITSSGISSNNVKKYVLFINYTHFLSETIRK